jgi:hypothetical protein
MTMDMARRSSRRDVEFMFGPKSLDRLFCGAHFQIVPLEPRGLIHLEIILASQCLRGCIAFSFFSFFFLFCVALNLWMKKEHLEARAMGIVTTGNGGDDS